MHIAAASLVLFYLWGGMEYLLWVGCVRAVVVLHFTFSVNSLTHRFGYRSYKTADSSTNNWLVALFAFGEGWHNNHHRFPRSAKMGLKRWEIDVSFYWIKILEKLHLASSVKVA